MCLATEDCGCFGVASATAETTNCDAGELVSYGGKPSSTFVAVAARGDLPETAEDGALVLPPTPDLLPAFNASVARRGVRERNMHTLLIVSLASDSLKARRVFAMHSLTVVSRVQRSSAW